MTRFAVSLILGALLLGASPPRASDAQLAVVTDREAPVSALSLDDLRRIFLGKSTSLAGRHVTVVELVPARAAFYKRLLGLGEDEVRRRWVAMAFRGEVSALPQQVHDAAELRRFISEHPGAIGFVDASEVDESVKVLAIGGRRPSEPGYPLH